MGKHMMQYLEIDVLNKTIKFLEREKDIFIGEDIILYRNGVTEDTTQAAARELGFTYGAAVCIPQKNIRGFYRVYEKDNSGEYVKYLFEKDLELGKGCVLIKTLINML